MSQDRQRVGRLNHGAGNAIPPGMRLRIISLFLILGFLAAGWSTAPAAAQDDPRYAVSAGVFDLINGNPSGEAGLELRFSPWRWADLIPIAGVTLNTDGGGYVFGGVRHEWRFADRWIAAPHFALTAFEEGDGRDLGSVLEFRSGIEVSYDFDGGSRLGLSFYHLSNAGIDEMNPGSESLVLVWSF